MAYKQKLRASIRSFVFAVALIGVIFFVSTRFASASDPVRVSYRSRVIIRQIDGATMSFLANDIGYERYREGGVLTLKEGKLVIDETLGGGIEFNELRIIVPRHLILNIEPIGTKPR